MSLSPTLPVSGSLNPILQTNENAMESKRAKFYEELKSQNNNNLPIYTPPLEKYQQILESLRESNVTKKTLTTEQYNWKHR